MRKSIAVVVAFALTASNVAHAQDDPLAAVAWLAGCWAAEGREAGSVEHWLAPAGGTMLGMSRMVRWGRTVQFEFMQFRIGGNGKLEFVALPSGQKETSFVLVSSSDGLAAFEAPAHDFPQKVTYQALQVDAWSVASRARFQVGRGSLSSRTSVFHARQMQFTTEVTAPILRLSAIVRRHTKSTANRKGLAHDHGTCLCGAVSLEIDEPLEKSPEACHCSQCRKQTGNFFVGVNVRRSALRVAQEERLTWYQSSEKVLRGFCSTCGSVMFWKPTIPGYEWTGVALGAWTHR